MNTIEHAPARRSKWRSTLATAVILALIGGGIWYWMQGNTAAPEKRSRPPAVVGVATAALGDMPVYLQVIGSAQPIVSATVRTQLAGVLYSIDFVEGQQVQEGQKLAQIDPRPYQLALALAESNLARDQALLTQAIADSSRFQKLLREDSIARQQVDTQSALVKQLQGTLAADKAQIEIARLNLGYTTITAPVSGRIGLRLADIGNYLKPTDANGIAIVTQTAPMDVGFYLSQQQLHSIRAAMKGGAAIAATAQDQTTGVELDKGEFLTFDNQVDATSGTVKAKARFDNKAGALFPNQFVTVQLLTETVKQGVILPLSAIRHGANGDFVFLVQPDRSVKLQPVRTGPSDGVRVIIQSGIEAGEVAVAEGADSLDNGSKVRLPGDKPRDGGDKGKPGGGKPAGSGNGKTGEKPASGKSVSDKNGAGKGDRQ